MTAVVKIQELTKLHSPGRGVEGLELVIEPGEVCGIVGPNGSGKTTALHCLTGLQKADRIVGTIAGHVPGSVEAKKVVTFAPDDLDLPKYLTGSELLQMHAAARGDSSVARYVDFAEAFGLADALGGLLSEYSHGMKRKAMLACALGSRPHMVIYDEPFRGLDTESVLLLRSLMKQLSEAGTAQLVATHDLVLAADFSRTTVLRLSQHVGTLYGDQYTGNERHREFEEDFLKMTGLAASVQNKLTDLKVKESQ